MRKPKKVKKHAAPYTLEVRPLGEWVSLPRWWETPLHAMLEASRCLQGEPWRIVGSGRVLYSTDPTLVDVPY